MPEIQDSLLYLFPCPFRVRGHVSGDFFGLFWGGLFVANPLPPTPPLNERGKKAHSAQCAGWHFGWLHNGFFSCTPAMVGNSPL